MDGSKKSTPLNTTKKTGAICAAAGSSLLIGAILVFLVGFSLKLDILYIAITVTFLAIGVLMLIIGIGMLIQGRKVSRILSGKDLIAAWDYGTKEEGNDQSGYIYIGESGFYKNGVFTEWTGKTTIEDVFLSEGDHTTLTFQYVLSFNNSNPASTGSVRKRTKVPVPIDKKDDAKRVVDYYKRTLSADL